MKESVLAAWNGEKYLEK